MAKPLTETRKEFQKHVLHVLSRDGEINFLDLDSSGSDTILLAKLGDDTCIDPRRNPSRVCEEATEKTVNTFYRNLKMRTHLYYA